MGRWEPDAYGCLYDNKGCFARVSPNKAERLAKRHNADIDALEPEIKRLKNNLAVSRKQADKFLEIIGLDPDTQMSRAERAEAERDRLTAERDELQRRLDAVVKMLEPKKPMPQHEDFHPFDIDQWNDAVCAWDRNAARHALAVAIAEGRTE